MKHHALVIDDNPGVLEDVKDRLEGLRHSCDCVTCLQDARDLLGTNGYSYILLDLEIPVRYGRPSRIQNGQTLLRELREMRGYEHIPVIVMTSHGHDSPDLAVQVLRGNGAIDYVRKPFPETGHTLEKAVSDAVAGLSGTKRSFRLAQKAAGTPGKSATPKPFESGELVFYPNRVALCGVKILGSSGLGHSRRMLDMLRKKDRGRFVRLSGEDIAERIGEAVNAAILIGTITGCAKTLRTNIRTRLSRDLNLVCEHDDVLVRDDQGYHLNDEKITVRDGDDDEIVENVPAMLPNAPSNVPATTENDPASAADVPANDPASTENVPASSADDPANVPSNDPAMTDDLNERQKWILDQTRKGREVRRLYVEKKYDISEKTAKRDFSILVKHKLIEYVRAPHPGHYRRVQ